MAAKQQQKPEQQPPPSDASLITIIAGALAINASAQATATTLSPLIGIPVPSLLLVLLLSETKPPTYGIATLPSASALVESQKLEVTYRAQYILAASRRVQAALKTGVSRQDAIDREKAYFRQHLDAITNRKRAASQVDDAARRYGPELGWHAILDNRTSPECRAANGKNFNVTTRPPIGYPGAVHPYCRCKAGKPFTTSKTVYSVKPEKRA